MDKIHLPAKANIYQYSEVSCFLFAIQLPVTVQYASYDFTTIYGDLKGMKIKVKKPNHYSIRLEYISVDDKRTISPEDRKTNHHNHVI